MYHQILWNSQQRNVLSSLKRISFQISGVKGLKFAVLPVGVKGASKTTRKHMGFLSERKNNKSLILCRAEGSQLCVHVYSKRLADSSQVL